MIMEHTHNEHRDMTLTLDASNSRGKARYVILVDVIQTLRHSDCCSSASVSDRTCNVYGTSECRSPPGRTDTSQ
jgi:hypothetical protein